MNSGERDLCRIAYDMKELGATTTDIARAVGLDWRKCNRWLKNPSKYDPYLDEIAITRALEAERSVWDALTVWELDEVYAALQRRKNRMWPEDWLDFFENFCGCLGIKANTVTQAMNRAPRDRPSIRT